MVAGSYLNYLLVIARNYLLQLLRRQKLKLADLHSESTNRVEPMSPEDTAVNNQLKTALSRYLNTLPLIDQMLLQKRYIERAPRHLVQQEFSLSLMQLRYKEAQLLDGLRAYLRLFGF